MSELLAPFQWFVQWSHKTSVMSTPPIVAWYRMYYYYSLALFPAPTQLLLSFCVDVYLIEMGTWVALYASSNIVCGLKKEVNIT